MPSTKAVTPGKDRSMRSLHSIRNQRRANRSDLTGASESPSGQLQHRLRFCWSQVLLAYARGCEGVVEKKGYNILKSPPSRSHFGFKTKKSPPSRSLFVTEIWAIFFFTGFSTAPQPPGGPRRLKQIRGTSYKGLQRLPEKYDVSKKLR